MNAIHESYNGKSITGSEVDGMNIIEMKLTGVVNKCKSGRERQEKHIVMHSMIRRSRWSVDRSVGRSEGRYARDVARHFSVYPNSFN